MEHPRGSEAWKTDAGLEIQTKTQEVTLDMCAFGLKIPGTTKYLRKSTQIQTTSPEMWNQLQDKRCSKNHEHVPIAGSMKIHGKSTKLSKFCASYCHGFANKIAGAIVSASKARQVPSQDAFVIRERPDHEGPNAEDEHVSKRARHTGDAEMPPEAKRPLNDAAPRPFKRLRMSATPAVGQEAITEQSIDRSNEEEWKEVFQEANRLAPRVGSFRIENGHSLSQKLQKMLPQLSITCVFSCRGTDRFQLPVNMPSPAEAPLRQTIILHRNTRRT